MNTIKRALFVAAALAVSLVSGISPALASTGPWTWSDLSSLIAERQNRPIWAMAYASPYWYFTDGQDLWSGGHVWKTEGSVIADITYDVRNAGLSRVDDMVNDGATVLFLKNVTARNNSFEVWSYNGSMSNQTSRIRSYLDSDESIASIQGKNGTWAVVTSKGRVYFWTFLTGSITQFSTGVTITSTLPYRASVLSTWTGWGSVFPVAVAPVADGWLIAAGGENNGMKFFKRKDDGTSQDITSRFEQQGISFMASNGVTAFFGEFRTGRYEATALYAARIATYDGTTVRTIAVADPNALRLAFTADPNALPKAFTDAKIGWNGTSWMIVAGKRITRFDGTSFQDLGATRDYFTTIAGSLNGTFLLGGAESTDGSFSPSYPLMAKLTKVTEGTASVTTNTSSNVTIANNISSWTWLDPNQTWINQNQTMTFNVGSWSANGLQRIEIIVNGSVRRTCELYGATGNQTCNATLYGGDYPLYTSAAVNAKITDTKGQVAWTTLQNIYATNNGTTYSTYNSNTSGDVSTWISLDPAGSVLNRNSSTTLRVSASASQGLSRVDVYGNSSLLRTCSFSYQTGTQTCDVTVSGWNYTAGTTLTLNTKATDVNGKTAWSDNRIVTIQDAPTTVSTASTGTSSANMSSWIWSSPDVTALATNGSATFNIGAWGKNGLQRIEIYVNGSIWNTCNWGVVYGNQTCATTINASSFGTNATVFVNAKITDGNGQVAWSDARTYTTANSTTVTTNTPSASTNQTGWINIWSNRDNGYARYDRVTFTANANDADGINRIDLLVNGVLVKSCNTQTTCTYSGSYANRTSVSYGANLVDNRGSATWTGYRAIRRK